MSDRRSGRDRRQVRRPGAAERREVDRIRAALETLIATGSKSLKQAASNQR